MHHGARAQLKQLFRSAVDACVVVMTDDLGTKLEFSSCDRHVNAIGDFIRKNLGKWMREDYCWLYAFFSLNDALIAGGFLQTAGPLTSSMTDEQREAVTDHLCEVWSAIPHTYEFAFPLPGLETPPFDCQIGPGVTLTKVPRSDVDRATLYPMIGLGALAGLASEPLVPCLKVTTAGLMRFQESTEVPSSTAIRTAKVVIQLGFVEGLFATDVRGAEGPKYCTYRASVFTGALQLPLPAAFARVLRSSLLVPSIVSRVLPTAMLIKRFEPIGIVLEHDRTFDPATKQPQKSSRELPAYYVGQQCARIATAAEWFFDARNEPDSAMTFVQLAIAFEALYGGTEEEPVGSTISNRIAYSVGQSTGEREELRAEFVEFYKTRSKVVHRGATKLNYAQYQQFRKAQHVLTRCLRRELELLPTAVAEVTSIIQ